MKAKGVKELKKHGMGDKLSIKQALIAKCADCLGSYADGKADCAMPDCPLYPWMPYGMVWKGRVKKIIPVDRLKAMRQGIKRGRKRAVPLQP